MFATYLKMHFHSQSNNVANSLQHPTKAVGFRQGADEMSNNVLRLVSYSRVTVLNPYTVSQHEGAACQKITAWLFRPIILAL